MDCYVCLYYWHGRDWAQFSLKPCVFDHWENCCRLCWWTYVRLHAKVLRRILSSPLVLKIRSDLRCLFDYWWFGSVSHRCSLTFWQFAWSCSYGLYNMEVCLWFFIFAPRINFIHVPVFCNDGVTKVLSYAGSGWWLNGLERCLWCY